MPEWLGKDYEEGARRDADTDVFGDDIAFWLIAIHNAGCVATPMLTFPTL